VLVLALSALGGHAVYQYGYFSGRQRGYPEGWFDRHMRDDFAKKIFCGQYWKYVESLCHSDQVRREEKW